VKGAALIQRQRRRQNILTKVSLYNITDIFDAADERLFCKILHHPNHLLASLLPKESHTPYHLRPRRHNRQLTPKINKLYDSNFVQRMLYKDLY